MTELWDPETLRRILWRLQVAGMARLALRAGRIVERVAKLEGEAERDRRMLEGLPLHVVARWLMAEALLTDARERAERARRIWMQLADEMEREVLQREQAQG